jgi:hypothetical protein
MGLDSHRGGGGELYGSRGGNGLGDLLKYPKGFAVAVNGPDIDVTLARANTERLSALAQVFVDEGTDVFVALAALEPKVVKVVKNRARHLESTPDPV